MSKPVLSSKEERPPSRGQSQSSVWYNRVRERKVLFVKDVLNGGGEKQMLLKKLHLGIEIRLEVSALMQLVGVVQEHLPVV